VPLSSNEVKVSASYLTSIAITPTNASILAGTVQQFTAIGMYNNNSTENITSSVTWNSSNQSIATISSLGLATGVGPGSTPITATLGSISSNSATLNVAVYAYVTNFSNSTVSVCPVNSNGTLGTCVAASDPTFSGPSSISINLIKSLAYVSNYYTSIISVCPINTNGTLGLCNALIDATFNGPSTVKLNTGNTFAYIVNYNHSNVSICPINSDGTFGVCTASNPGSTFINPDVITLNQTNTFAYVSNTTNHSVSVCSVNSDGSLGSCTAGFDPTFNGASALALNSAGTLIYVGNNNGTVSVCPINSNGMLATCTAMSSATFIGNNFGKIALNILSTIAYIANQTNNHISLCPINANGTFGTCLTSNPGGTFDGPQGIGLS
jgi:6-phosphogluconolactonase (cycloisomerase 2 family)